MMSYMDDTERVLAVQAALPIDSDLALSHFIQGNPRWEGAQWADALDYLLNADALIRVTDSMFESLDHMQRQWGMDGRRLIAPVALTLFFAYPERSPAPFDVEAKVWTVLGYHPEHRIDG
jgi:hypothetical protein